MSWSYIYVKCSVGSYFYVYKCSVTLEVTGVRRRLVGLGFPSGGASLHLLAAFPSCWLPAFHSYQVGIYHFLSILPQHPFSGLCSFYNEIVLLCTCLNFNGLNRSKPRQWCIGRIGIVDRSQPAN